MTGERLRLTYQTTCYLTCEHWHGGSPEEGSNIEGTDIYLRLCYGCADTVKYAAQRLIGVLQAVKS